MSFLKGSITFFRFRVAGAKPKQFDDAHLERLRNHAAGRDRIVSADAISTGFTAGNSCMDTEFTLDKNVYPDHLCFDFWTETNKLPTDRLKAYYEADLKALIQNNPSGRPSAKQKREAKESARDRLEEEAKDGRWRKWKCIPVIWDALTNIVYFGSTSLTAADRFQRLWEKAFEGNVTQTALAGELEAITASTLAIGFDQAAENEHLSPFVPGVTPEGGPSWIASETDVSWLGNEFLLWLWWYHEIVSDTLVLPDETDCQYMFSGGMKVEDPRGISGNGTMNSASAAKLPEARAAVKAGKLPRKTAITIERLKEPFAFVLNAEHLSISRGKLPTPKEDNTAPRGLQEDRLQQVRDFSECLDAMYETFIRRRLSAYWSSDVAEIAGWLASGNGVKRAA
jgi:hypothetical protein